MNGGSIPRFTLIRVREEIAMKVWIVSELHLMDSELDIKVFPNEEQAYEFACNCAKTKLDYLSADEDDVVTYKEFISLFSQNKYDKALNIYEDYICELDFEWQSTITVGSHDVEMNVCESKLEDVPCRNCGKGVNSRDKECWWCGVLSPLHE